MRHVVVWLTSWRTRWRLYEYLRNSLWIVPFLCVALALAAGFLLPVVDEHVTGTIGIVYGADAGRALLGAIAGGMITFTGFVFSILLLAVQFGSSQFSPRMLRRFLRDPSTKAALGIFMATFIYALTVLRVVGTGRHNAFVPSNSISVALILLLLSMLMFLRLITRTTHGLRVAAVVAELGRDARRIVDRVYPDPVAGVKDEADHDPDPAGPVRTVTYKGKPGIVQSVDFKSLVDRASKADVVIELVPRLGDLVSAGWALFRVHGNHSAIDDEWLRGTGVRVSPAGRHIGKGSISWCERRDHRHAGAGSDRSAPAAGRRPSFDAWHRPRRQRRGQAQVPGSLLGGLPELGHRRDTPVRGGICAGHAPPAGAAGRPARIAPRVQARLGRR
jgi:uncharacterized membrane protein